jgi:hypothetical protein
MPAALLAFVLAGCHSQGSSAAEAQPPSSGDPASVNLAPASNVTTAPNAENPPPPPPDETSNSAPPPDDQYAGDQSPDQSGDYEDTAEDVAPEPPPPLPDYDQPPAPGDDYEWTPGYWAYASDGYYWVPGEWVLAPWVGALWTPGYWGFYDGRYRWNHGYWGPHIGFYGGINYGYGYDGDGYEGGYWRNNHFYYNRDVTHIDTNRVHDVYSYRVPNRNDARVSYNGGHGGRNDRPTQAQMAARNERHVAPLPSQRNTAQNAQHNPGQFEKTNHGHPQNVAETQAMNDGRKAPAARPEDFHPVTTPHGTPGHPAASPVTGIGRPNGHPVYNNHAAPETRTAPQARTEPNQQAGREERPVTRPTRQPEQRPNQQPQTTGNPHPPQHAGARPGLQIQPRQVQPRQEQPRQEQPRQVQPRQVQPRQVQPHTQPQPHADQRAAPQPRQETRPAQPQRQENRPSPQPRQEHPGSSPHENHPAPQPRQEQHPQNGSGDKNPH